MKQITVPSYDQVDNASKVVFDYFQKVAGKMPNQYCLASSGLPLPND